MRPAATVRAIIHERGTRGLPRERVHHLHSNRDRSSRADAKRFPNNGALTSGSTDETRDGMSVATIERLIAAMRQRRFRWTPMRRGSIPKTNGKRRPLGITRWRDTLLQDVMRRIRAAYDELPLSDHAHSFRSGRGGHTALRTMHQTWTGTHWCIADDLLSSSLRTIAHDTLIDMLGKPVHDPRLLRRMRALVHAGDRED